MDIKGSYTTMLLFKINIKLKKGKSPYVYI